jgi:GT2 family glycosyltransferase
MMPPASEVGGPGVDVAIPCYQYGRFLRPCVTSVLAQGVPGVRVLIIDNASTDDSLEVAQELARENAAVEVVAHRRNVGPHASFNEAVDWAARKYFLLLCADDQSAPGALGRAVAVMERHSEVALTYGAAALLRSGQPLPATEGGADAGAWRILSGEALLARFCASAVCHVAGCTAIVRTEVQKEVGYYRPAMAHTDDFEMWMRFACRGSAAETPAVQGVLRSHETSQTALACPQHRWDILHCEEAFTSFFANEGGRLADARRWRRLARRSLGERAYWSAMAHLARGDVAEVPALLGMAVTRSPISFFLPPVSYLFRRQDARARLKHVLSRSFGDTRSFEEFWGHHT